MKKKNFFNVCIVGIFILVIVFYPKLINYFNRNLYLLNEDYSFSKDDAKKLIKIIDSEGIYGDKQKWVDKKDDYLSDISNAKNDCSRLKIVARALYVGGSKHSSVVAGSYKINDDKDKKSPMLLSEYKVEDSILIISMPQTSQGEMDLEEYSKKYAKIIIDAINKNSKVDGIIIDLRDNYGGSILPMIIGVSPLLSRGELFSMKDRNNNKLQSLELKGDNLLLETYIKGKKINIIKENIKELKKNKIEKPVAVLISNKTMSAAEMTLLCLKQEKNVRVFGKESGGFVSANKTFNIGKNVSVTLTTAYISVNGVKISDGKPIKPDVKTENELKLAKKWIKEYE